MDIETLEKELQNARRIIEEKDKIISKKDEIIDEMRKELLVEIRSNDDKIMRVAEFLKQLSQVTRGIHEKTVKLDGDLDSAKFVIDETRKAVSTVLSEARDSFRILKNKK